MDWNVFFSTVSQSFGSIIGIFCAFLITKIISNQSDFNLLKNKYKIGILESINLKDKISTRYFDWYNERRSDNACAELKKEIENISEFKSAYEYYSELNFSPFQNKDEVIFSINAVIDERKIKIAKERELTERRNIKISELKDQLDKAHGAKKTFLQMEYNDLIRYNTMTNYALVSSTFPPLLIGADVIEERELIDIAFIDMKKRIGENEILLDDINNVSSSSSVIQFSICTIIFLFLIGVIYPLSFLPMEVGSEINLTFSAFFKILFSLKGVLLALITVGFVSLMVYFYNVSESLRFSEDEVKALQDYISFGGYSIYFKHYIENTKN